MNIAICDDDESQLSLVEGYINSLSLGNLNVLKFLDGKSLLECFRSGEYLDIIFLDVMLGDLNGIEIAREINFINKKPVVILFTNSLDYALEGYEVNAFRYLVKPLDKDTFLKVFSQALKEVVHRNSQCYSVILKGGSVLKIELEDILYLESYGKNMVAHVNGREIVYTASISSVEEALVPNGFIRIHKSYIVNLRHIIQISRNCVRLKGDITLPLSRKRQKHAYDAFTMYLASGYQH